MRSKDERAHGVTPGLRKDYVSRTALKQAAFVLPYLQPGMKLLDIGCGPGSITVGLANAVAPGHVTGIDHDTKHITTAKLLADKKGITNVNFVNGDALSLPFSSNTFDAIFENNAFIHISKNASIVASEALRVLKPGGLFAARDADAGAAIWGGKTVSSLTQFDELFHLWHQKRGSDITLGRQLPSILREAGFIKVVKSVSADTKGTPADVQANADMLVSLLEGPLGKDSIKYDWADIPTIDHLKKSILKWGNDPDAFFANIHVEVIGWKPD